MDKFFGYFGEQRFRIWCQKVLPTVYDDSLSYYELLCKVLKVLQEFGAELSTLEGFINDTLTVAVANNGDKIAEAEKAIEKIAEKFTETGVMFGETELTEDKVKVVNRLPDSAFIPKTLEWNGVVSAFTGLPTDVGIIIGALQSTTDDYDIQTFVLCNTTIYSKSTPFYVNGVAYCINRNGYIVNASTGEYEYEIDFSVYSLTITRIL